MALLHIEATPLLLGFKLFEIGIVSKDTVFFCCKELEYAIVLTAIINQLSSITRKAGNPK